MIIPPGFLKCAVRGVDWRFILIRSDTIEHADPLKTSEHRESNADNRN